MPAPASPNTISGKYAVVTINGVLIAGPQGWTADETADQLDGTTGGDLGYENDDTGVQRLEFDLEIVQNLAVGIYTIVQAGTVLTNLRLYRSAGDPQPAFTVPIARIYKSTNTVKTRERATVNVKGRSNGPYTATDPGAG